MRMAHVVSEVSSFFTNCTFRHDLHLLKSYLDSLLRIHNILYNSRKKWFLQAVNKILFLFFLISCIIGTIETLVTESPP